MRNVKQIDHKSGAPRGELGFGARIVHIGRGAAPAAASL